MPDELQDQGTDNTGDAKDFNYDVSGEDIELDSAGVGVSSEGEDGLSPEAHEPVSDTRRQTRQERPSSTSRRAAEPEPDDEDDDEDDEGRDRQEAADARRPTRRERRSLPARYDRIRRRVDEATWRLRDAERQIEERRRQLAQLDAEIARKGGLPPADTKPDTRNAQPSQPAKAERPKRPRMPRWSEFEKAGKTWDEYEEAQAKYEEELDKYDEQMAEYLRTSTHASAEEKLIAQRVADAKRAQQEAHLQRMRRLRERNPNWRELEAALEGLESQFLYDAIYYHDKGDEILEWAANHRDLVDEFVQLPLTNSMMAAIQSSSNPVPLLQYLAEHLDETERIAWLPTAPALKRLGAIEARLEGASSDTNGSSRDARWKPAAPPPSQRAGSRSGAVRRNPDEESVDEYFARRTREEREKKLAAYGLRA